MRKDVLNFFSPFPPTQSGVSDYSFAIAKRISRENDVLPIVKTPQEKDFLTSHGLAAEIFDKTTMPAGLSIFQIGNSAAHDYLFRASLKTPGIVVIHDLLLHGLIKSATLGYNEVAEYKSLMEFEGPSGHLVAERTLVGDFKPLYAAFVGGHRKLVEGVSAMEVSTLRSARVALWRREISLVFPKTRSSSLILDLLRNPNS